MKVRSGFKVMSKLIILVKPLTIFMIMAIITGFIGHLCASFITIFGTYAALKIAGFSFALSIKQIFIFMIIIAILRGFLRYAEQTLNHFIAFKLLALIRDKIFFALRKLCPAKLEGKDKGDLINVITSDIELLEVFYAHTVSPTAIAALFSIFMSIFIGFYHYILGIVAFIAYLTIGAIIPLVTSKFSRDIGLKLRNKAGLLSGFVLDSLHGLSEILQYSKGEKRVKDMQDRTDELIDDEKIMKRNIGANIAFTGSLIFAFDITMLIVGIILYNFGLIKFDAIVISTLAMMSSFGPVTSLAALGGTLQNTFAAGNRVLNILEEEPLVVDVNDGMDVEFKNADAKNVSFSYGDELILDDVSLSVKKGEILGLKGKSGSGKSTLLKLFMRFWSVNKGEMDISGVSVENINTASLRDIQSFVTQDTHLFHDSIAANLRIAKLDATNDELVVACKKASIHDFIMKLPNGYDTLVGELGDTLSGGEKQRIGLARAFLHNAPFMLLDEPTSNLDSLNEAVILQSILRERKEKTVLLVSHRNSTMAITDRMFVMDNGRVS